MPHQAGITLLTLVAVAAAGSVAAAEPVSRQHAVLVARSVLPAADATELVLVRLRDGGRRSGCRAGCGMTARAAALLWSGFTGPEGGPSS